MARKQEWDLKKLLRTTQQQVEDPENLKWMRDDQIVALRKELTRPTKNGLIALNGALRILGSWEGLVGAVGASRGDADGWTHMRLCLLYRAWAVRLCVAARDQNGRGTLGLRDQVIECLAQAMATREDDFAHWCGERVLRSFQDKDGAFENAYSTPFEPFMIHLYAHWRGKSVDLNDRTDCPLGVYKGILDAWDSETAYAKAVVEACDYHCERVMAKSGYSEFGNTPFHVFPAEIIAVRRVRRELGLPDPEVEHRLLDSPFSQVPESPPPIDDFVLTEVAARVRKDCPGVGTPW